MDAKATRTYLCMNQQIHPLLSQIPKMATLLELELELIAREVHKNLGSYCLLILAFRIVRSLYLFDSP